MEPFRGLLNRMRGAICLTGDGAETDNAGERRTLLDLYLIGDRRRSLGRYRRIEREVMVFHHDGRCGNALRNLVAWFL
jgi:hypothetical protein